jgi:hypothetical protein
VKITGRNIKRRLYGLSRLPSNIKRARYWRGHGVHSPFVYTIVREVFMCRKFKSEQRELFNALTNKNVAERRAMELQNLLLHCKYSTYAIDVKAEQMDGYDFVIATLDEGNDTLTTLAQRAAELGITLCILSPSYDRNRDKVCQDIVKNHRCTSIDNRAYLLMFNNHLPKQEFKL